MGPTFANLAELRPYAIWTGALARAVHGERLTIAVIDLEPSLEIAEHHHDNEQLGIVLKGEITMTIGGSSKPLKAGDTYSIPPNVPHSARTSAEGATVIDVFAPVRTDWEAKDRLPASAGLWP